MHIIPLSEGVFTIGHDKIFHPFDTNKDEITDRPTGSLLVEVQPFLVITSQDVLLLDTGLGFNNEAGQFHLHANLLKAGYTPEQVTKVLMSHLHKDHAGGLCYQNNHGLLQPSLPNATYYIYRPEADFALETGKPSFQPEEIEPLLATSQVHWLDGEEGEIAGGIKFWHTGGHSPQHIVYLIEENEEKIFFGGDEAPQLKQLKMRYVAKYDHDGKKAMQLREKWALQGREEAWQVLFYHDIAKPVVQL